MDIRKVKSTNGLILIRAEEASGEEDIRRIELESRAEPRPEFHEAMGGLIAPAMDMIQAPSAWMAVATISGLSLTHEEERGMGAVVTLLVPLECAPSPLVINTPYLSEGPTSSAAHCCQHDLRQAIERVIDEALRYMRRRSGAGRPVRGTSGARRGSRRDELEPALIVAGKLVVGSEHLAEEMNEQSAAEPESLSDGPILDRPPHEVRAEFERIRTEAMRKQPVIKPARGRRADKATSDGGLSPMRILLGFLFLFLIASPLVELIVLVLLVLLVCWLVGELILSSLFWSVGQIMTTRSNPA